MWNIDELKPEDYGRFISANDNVNFAEEQGFVHAKGIVADGIVASVGSINFDYRSLYLHFECGVFFYGVEEIKDIEKDMQETIAKSEEIKAKNGGFKGFWLRVWGALLKVFSPLF